MNVADLVGRLAAAVTDLGRVRQRVLVGIDGPDAAGKTTLADALAAALPGEVHRASVDDFPRPPEERYRRGELSPEGFYRDGTDLPRLVGECLVPFRDGVSGAGPAVLVVDGVFVLRPKLRHFWHLSVYLRVPEEVTLARALVRALARYDSAAEVEHRYRARYVPGQALYRAEVDPERAADVLVDNRDPARPRMLRWGRG